MASLTSTLSSRCTGTYLLPLSVLVLASVLCSHTTAQEITLIAKGDSAEEGVRNQISTSAQTYGLTVRDLSPRSRKGSTDIANAIKKDSGAVIIETSALAELDQAATFRALTRRVGPHIPLLLIAGSSPQESRALSRWTNGQVEGCKPLANTSGWSLAFNVEAPSAGELRGVSLGLPTAPNCELLLSHASHAQTLAEARRDGRRVPTSIAIKVGAQPVFVVTVIPSSSSPDGSSTRLQEVFSPLAGLMMFMHQAIGDESWHLPGHYANLTIDDPWLIEPYGNFSYHGILRAMEEHKFHTTIAFIPWNFDRSEAGVVSLFRNNPNRLSVSIHGNNHNHREFDQYSKHSLDSQAANIRQALARMEAFSRATGIPYDRVMVFPHGIAPAGTLGLLKKDNIWATVNSQDVPLNSPSPADPLLVLRPWTLRFGNFLSIKRTSAAMPVSRADIAINAFLGNPQLFYVHQDFFHHNIGAFNDLADYVNQADPAVRWSSLGYITQHLYLLRLRKDHDYDVLALSPHVELVNPSERHAVFHIRRSEMDSAAIESVSVAGRPVSYHQSPAGIDFAVELEPKASRTIDVVYRNDLDLATVDISKSSLWISTLRYLSDLRDLQLSRSSVGSYLQYAYYNSPASLLGIAIISFFTFSLASAGGYLFIRRTRRLRAARLSVCGNDEGSQARFLVKKSRPHAYPSS